MTPLLRRHLAGVAGGRLESFYMAISCVDRGWAWLEVAEEVSPLAPRSRCIRLYLIQRKGASPASRRRTRAHEAGVRHRRTQRLSPRHLPADVVVRHRLVVNLIIR